MLLASLVSMQRAAGQTGEARFLDKYLCRVDQILNRIRAKPWEERDEQNRFLILYLASQPGVYTQCAFYDAGTAVQCEAVSPYYAAPGEPFRNARLPALARLGYDLDASRANYVRRFRLDAEDSPPLAEFMLRSLYEGYLDESDGPIGFEAPLAKAWPPAPLCAPTS